MKTSTIALLVLAALAAVVAAFVVQRPAARGAERATATGPLVPGLEDRMNDVARLEIAGAGGAVTVERVASGWVLPDAGGFPADVAKARSALVALAALEKVEPKTANAARFGDLGLETPDASAAATEEAAGAEEPRAGTRVRALDATGATIADVVLGRTAPSASFDRPERYARRADVAGDEARAYLVAGRADIDARRAGWMAREVPTLPRARPAVIEIAHTDGERLRVERQGEEWTLAGLPAGREPRWPGAAGSLAGLLESLAPEDAKPRAELPQLAAGSSEAVVATVRTEDGLVLEARTVELDGATWLAVDARAEAVVKTASAESAATGAADADAALLEDLGSADVPASQDVPAGDVSEPAPPASDVAVPVIDPAVEAEAQRWNDLFGRFAVQLPSWTAGNLRKRTEDLLKPEDAPPIVPTMGPPPPAAPSAPTDAAPLPDGGTEGEPTPPPADEASGAESPAPAPMPEPEPIPEPTPEPTPIPEPPTTPPSSDAPPPSNGGGR